MNQNRTDQSPRHVRGLFWPILLIGVGVVLLLSNLGVLPKDPWLLLWRLWPVILIAIGLDVLLGRRGMWGGLVSAGLAILVVAGVVAFLFFAQNNPAWLGTSPFFGETALRTEHVAQPLGQIRNADVAIHFPGGDGYLGALGDSSNLIEGDVSYYGNLINSVSSSGDNARVELSSESGGISPFFDFGRQKWNLSLNPGVTYDLRLEQGSGSNTYDLSKLALRSLSLDMGSGHGEVNLPSAGQYAFKIDVGSGSLNVRTPEGFSVRVQCHIGSGSLGAPNLRQVSGGPRDGVYESANFSQTGSYVVINLQMGSGSVTIR